MQKITFSQRFRNINAMIINWIVIDAALLFALECAVDLERYFVSNRRSQTQVIAEIVC